MKINDMLPGLDDKALTNVWDNARRLMATGTPKQQKEAAEALPLIEAERAGRKAASPLAAARAAKPKTARPRKVLA